MVWAAPGPAGPNPGGPPPLTVDKAAPLLLDEATTSAKPANLRKLICHDCHANYLEEPFAVAHDKAGVTCLSCHGESMAHSGDENNITPPEVMYAREAIAPKCRQCHPDHNAAAIDVIVLWQRRGLQKLDARQLVCTDCHGEHRLKVRTVEWDKKTGKPLPAKGRAKPRAEQETRPAPPARQDAKS
ncbi:MAG: cytochrome c3 family protein [bacterium]|nr:cytochrome c3 family protein [bacterium]